MTTPAPSSTASPAAASIQRMRFTKPTGKKVKTVVSVMATALVVSGGATWMVAQHHRAALQTDLASRYTADGYGGYTARSQAKTEGESLSATNASGASGVTASGASVKPTTTLSFASAKKPLDLIVPVRAAYAKGDYKQAETVAGQVVEAARALPKNDPKRPAAMKVAARARFLQAFASARQHDMVQAREQFAQLKAEASALPDKGKVTPSRVQVGAPPEPTLLENAAYQHAVCTSALGDKTGAEREYIAFMKAYPDSPLVQASIKRIARFHGGDIPKDAEAVWQNAMQEAQKREQEKQKQMSLCAPQCLAELLKRQGKTASVTDLTREMRTNAQGTSLADLCAVAKRHGISKAQGAALTDAGLKKQKLPLVALVSPGHYVLVEQVKGDGSVRVWNPSGTQDAAEPAEEQAAPALQIGTPAGPHATRFTYTAPQWKWMWRGIALLTQ